MEESIIKILLVEDDQLLGEGITAGLQQHKYTTEWIQDGVEALDILLSAKDREKYDAVILDLGLPKKSGLEILKTIRDEGIAIPVLILTARDSIQDKVQGLDHGADDYIVKPFDLAELCARLRSIVRRGQQEQSHSKLSLGGVMIDPEAHKIFVDGKQVDFSRREFSLLSKLVEQRGKVVTRDVLSQALYGWGDDVDSNAIEVHVHHIRKKIGCHMLIKTIRGIGYIAENTD